MSDTDVPADSHQTSLPSSGAAGIRARRKGIALCLSGGGFRAAIFHLGALRRLHEFGILSSVRTISSVSGGSIVAGFLATQIVTHGTDGASFQDWEAQVATPFRRFVGRDLRTWPVLRNFIWNWFAPGPRIRQLEDSYRRHLTSLQLEDLPERPDFQFCATDLAFGTNWVFSRDAVGGYQSGYVRDHGNWPVARAVAASSSFPPIFGPMSLGLQAAALTVGNYRGADRAKLVSRIALSDGGVYDNMGLEPVWKDHTCILVSDCGAPFELAVGANALSRLLRYTSVVTHQALGLRKRMLFADFDERRYSGTYWSLSSGLDPVEAKTGVFRGYSKSMAEEAIATVRTDLDRFTRDEIAVLENHGYFAVERAIRTRLPELITNDVAAVAPHPALMDEPAARSALQTSHRRVSLTRLFTRP